MENFEWQVMQGKYWNFFSWNIILSHRKALHNLSINLNIDLPHGQLNPITMVIPLWFSNLLVKFFTGKVSQRLDLNPQPKSVISAPLWNGLWSSLPSGYRYWSDQPMPSPMPRRVCSFPGPRGCSPRKWWQMQKNWKSMYLYKKKKATIIILLVKSN